MVISAYQVNNVLRVYGDQLRQTKISSRPKVSGNRSPDKISISMEAKRKAIINKISSNIVEKITSYGPQASVEKEVFQKLENEYGSNLAISGEGSTDIVFKEIDKDGETLNQLSVEDSEILRYKLEEITKETVDKNMM